MYKELKSSLIEAIEFHKGSKKLKTTKITIPDPPQKISATKVTKLRKKIGVSQSGLSKILNVSIKTVQAWESGRRNPSQASLRLFEILEKHPEYLLTMRDEAFQKVG